MALDTIILLAGMAVLGAVLVALLRRPAATDPLLLQKLDAMQAALDRQGERTAALPAEFERSLAREAVAIGDRIGASALDQTKALGDGIGRIADRLSAQEKAVLERLAADAALLTEKLAQDAKATRDAMAEQRAQVVKALTEHKDDTEALRRAVTQGIADTRIAFAEGMGRMQETLAAENTRARDLLDAKLKELRESNEQRLAEIQKTVNEQLQSAVEKQMNASFARVIDQFTAVQKAMTDVQAVTSQIGDIKRIFSNVKTRGGWAEAQVKALLDDILPGVPRALARTAMSLREDNDTLDALAATAYAALVGPDPRAADPGPAAGSPVPVPVEALAAHPPAIRRRVIRLWLHGCGVTDPTRPVIGAVDALVADWHGQGGVAIGGDPDYRLEAIRTRGVLTVRRTPRRG